MKSLLVVSTTDDAFKTIRECFVNQYEVDEAPNRERALDVLRGKRYDFVFIDLELLKDPKTGVGYKEAMQPFWHLYPTTEIIVISSQEMIREAVMTVKAGASNYLTRPINADEVRYVTESVSELALMQSELEYLREEFWEAESLEVVHTKNPEMRQVFEKIRSVAPTKSTVLLVGETGTGKGLLAKLIHKHSNRRKEAFINVHCGAIPDTLLESELFGHEKGAFTGAVRRRLGKFEIATGGTIFLDEIATITPSAQIKLLQIIQDEIFQRVGGEVTIQADVRIIAASNVDLKKMSDEGHFRRDLYYRLNVFPIEIPPLRERKEDIPLLVEAFLKNLNRFHDKEINDIDPHVMEAFQEYEWPGNIRELENLIERAYLLESSSILSPESFPKEIFPVVSHEHPLHVDTLLTLTDARRKAIDQFEIAYIKKILQETRGKIGLTARTAGITPRQLHKLMKKHGIHKEEFKFPAISSEQPSS